VSTKERIVFLDRAGLGGGYLPIPNFDHNWSEYPTTEAADIVPRLFWATTAITHACPIDADTLGRMHKLTRIVVTGPAMVDGAACEAGGIAVRYLPVSEMPGQALIDLLEVLIDDARR
jgi:hypothetical protein